MSTAAAAVETYGRARSGSASSDNCDNTSSDSGDSASSDSGSSTSRNRGGAAGDTADAVWAVRVADLDLLWVPPSRRSTLVSVDLPLSPEGILGLHLRRTPCPQHKCHAHRESDRDRCRDRDRDRDTDTDPPEHRSVHTGTGSGGHQHRRHNGEDRGRSRSRSRRRGHKQQRGGATEAALSEITLHGFNPDRNPFLNGALARARADPANRGLSSSASSSAAAHAPATDAWLPLGAVLRLVDGCEVAHPQQFAQLVADARERHLTRVAKLEALSPGSGARVRTVLRVGFDVSNVGKRRAGGDAGDDDGDDSDPDDTTSSPRLKLHTTSSKSMLSRAGAVTEPQTAPPASAAEAAGAAVAPLKAADL